MWLRRLLTYIIVLWVSSSAILAQEAITNPGIAFCNTQDRHMFERLDVMTIDSRMFVEIAVSPRGDLLAVATRGAVRIYSLPTFQLLYTLLEGEFPETWHSVTISWSPDGTLLAVATFIRTPEIPDPESRVRIWNVTSQELITSIPHVEVQQITWSEDISLLAVLEAIGEISVWNPQNGEKVAAYDAYESQDVIPTQIVWVRSGSQIVAVGDTVIFWEIEDNDISMIDVHSDRFQADVAWNQHTDLLTIYRGAMHDILAIDLDTRESYPFASSLGHVFDIAWSPDGTRLAAGTPFGLTLINQDQSVRTVRNGPIPEFTRIQWLPDNNNLISVTRSGIVFGWNIEQECLLGVIAPPQENND